MSPPKDKLIEPINAPFDAVASSILKIETGPAKLPIALYTGALPIGEIELDCAVLDNGQRVLSATSIFDAFGRARKGMNSRLEIEGTKIPPFLAAKNLEPYIDQSVIERTNLIRYKDGKSEKSGHNTMGNSSTSIFITP